MLILDKKTQDLRRFGLITGGLFVLIGLWPFIWQMEGQRVWAILVGALFLILGAVAPVALGPLHKVWNVFGQWLGWINTRLILGGIFYGLLTPIAIAKRALKRSKESETGSETYRIPKQPRPPSHMEHLF